MIKVQRMGDVTRIYAVSSDKRTLLASSFLTPSGLALSHGENIAFTEVGRGRIRTSSYGIGLGVPRKREFDATIDELKAKFAEAGIPMPKVVPLNGPVQEPAPRPAGVYYLNAA